MVDEVAAAVEEAAAAGVEHAAAGGRGRRRCRPSLRTVRVPVELRPFGSVAT